MSELQFTAISVANAGTTGTTDTTVTTGTAANDQLYRGKGSAVVDGRVVGDTAVYNGGFADYLVRHDSASGRITVGSGIKPDTLPNVEVLKFSDLLVRVDDARLKQTTQHTHTEGKDLLVGNDLGYALRGEGGDDTFVGNGGDDSLYGGKGNDTAVYHGKRSDYTIEYDAVARTVVVRDQVAGRDGSDTLYGVESLRFADGDEAVKPFPDVQVPAPDSSGVVELICFAGGTVFTTGWDIGMGMELFPISATVAGTQGELFAADLVDVQPFAAEIMDFEHVAVELVGIAPLWSNYHCSEL